MVMDADAINESSCGIGSVAGPARRIVGMLSHFETS